MSRPRMRLSWCLWLVAVAAAWLGGMQYADYRAKPIMRSIVYSDGVGSERTIRFDTHTRQGAAEFRNAVMKGREAQLKFRVE